MCTSGWAWDAEGMVGFGSSTASSGGRHSRYGGEAAPVDNRGRRGVGELHEDKAKLMVGSAWVEESYSGWSTVSFELVGARVGRLRCSGGSGLGGSE